MVNPFENRLQQKQITQSNPFAERLKQKEEPSALMQNLKEIPGQFAKGAVAGGIGSYGDVLDFFGLQSKEINPAEQDKRSREFKTLEKMERGEVPSAGELEELSEDEPVLRFSRLPSSEDVSNLIEEFGGPKEAKTTAGRYASRGGKLLGGGLSLGQGGIVAPLTAAAAGQTAEEFGAPKWVQAAVEIGTFLKSSKSKTPLTSKSPEIKSEIERLKKLGFSDQDITLAKNALEDRNWLKKTSQMTKEAETKFKQATKGTEEKFNKIIGDAFPGLEEGGTSALKTASSELFNSLDDLAQGIVIKDPTVFANNARKAITELEKTLAVTPQQSQVISLLEEAIGTAKPKPIPGKPEQIIETGLLDQFGKPITKTTPAIPETPRPFPTANYYTNFYKGLNSIGQWGNPKQREHVFSIVKDAIKNTFKEQGPEGKKLAIALEEANKSWMKYLQAEDIVNLTQKAITDEGINFAKMNKLIENANNFETFAKGLGKEQANNLKQIAKTGNDIKDLQKVIQGGAVKEALGAGKLWAVAHSVVTGDLRSLASYVGAQRIGKLSTKLLTDPSYQKIQLRMLEAIKDQKWNMLRVFSQIMEKKLDAESQ